MGDHDIDCTNAARGVWLVKVPKYISSRWEKATPMTEVGRLKITNVTESSDVRPVAPAQTHRTDFMSEKSKQMLKDKLGKPDIQFSLSEEVLRMRDPTEKGADGGAITKEHRFFITNIANQSMSVFSQQKGEETRDSAKLALEGHVVQKGECRPTGDQGYMQLKKRTILAASQPTRLVKQLERVVQNYKPVSNHQHNIEFEQKKKEVGKKSREDRDKVQEMLFAAFEKHQYYNIKDLEKITRQPIPYLKEILKEICNYNAKNPHKNMWELKPEYRHYKDTDMQT